ncbi:MAG TPA: hypothetical protein ENN34_06290 [Deltaproteobacteria bacterium]|nr:hypothetical protein [Deltaproteobacteria bacterium]
MQTAKKYDACACGVRTETYCSACCIPVCRYCWHLEVCSVDPNTVSIGYYCPKCKENEQKNVWGKLYWDQLVSLFT